VISARVLTWNVHVLIMTIGMILIFAFSVPCKARDRISVISIKPIRYLYRFNRYNRLSILK
jgi:hypothetical protein